MADRIVVDRVPTPRELEQGFADQIAQEYLRARQAYGGRAGAPGQLAGIDVLRPETLPPKAEPQPVAVAVAEAPPLTRPTAPRAYCTVCGKIFEHERKATAKAMATKCARGHPKEP